MNCFHHTQDSAVAQCSDCGKGLCPECAGKYSPILCTPCFQKRKRNEIRRSILSLLLLVALFVIGFQWDFLASYGHARWASGYTLMAIWSGYILIGRFKRPNRIVIATPIFWVLYHSIKFTLAVTIGIFTAPFTCVWSVYRVIKAFQ